MNNKVVVTGVNMVTSIGLDLRSSWENLKTGKCGVKKISLFDPQHNATKIAAQVPDDFEDYSKQFCGKRLSGKMTRVTKIGYVCAEAAIQTTGIDFDKYDRLRCSVIMGVVTAGFSSIEQKNSTKNRIIKGMNNALSAWISLKHKLEGPNFPISTACSSSAYAICIGYDLIKHGEADFVLVGGTDSIVNPEDIEGFNELYALSLQNAYPERASRPFTKDRDGFVIGEGAGMIILESEKSALARNAAIYARIAGYAFTSEAYNIMAPKINGKGMAKTMEQAIIKSQVNKEEIGYINAHGTSTPLNDKYETLAIKKVFGEKAYDIPVSSSKSMIGHTIGAAGAIEAVITIMSIRDGVLTPTIN
ncbi:MAG: beta-ketoacyl-[acyl-carrier-protein] synthase family protein, partial [Desulfobulbaceae bacterium]|nr:beta-ketoacyl-[acyl-carrier-protein] synthase family protein [Desulfobulbaceae bacterium]